MDASAVPHFRTGGPTAAAQTLGARERHTRGDAATMVDVTAGQGASTGNALTLSEIGNILKRGDIALALGILTILVVLILPLPALVLDLFLAISITLSILILMTSLFIQAPLEFSSFPTILLISTMLRLSLNLASTRLILAHGHEGTDAAGHVIEAFGNFVMSGNFVIGIIVFAILVHRELRGHHQGFGPHRRSRGALSPRRDARQADGDRRRSQRRPDRREGGARAPQGAGGRKRLLRRDGRRLEIRARRRHRGPARRLHQHHRRHHHRRRAAEPVVRRGRAHLHGADRRRRPRHAGAGADRLDRRGPAGVEGRRLRRRRQGADEAILRLSAGARHGVRRDVRAGAAARHSHAPVPRAVGRRGGHSPGRRTSKSGRRRLPMRAPRRRLQCTGRAARRKSRSPPR